jgi:hypothetical protein
MGDPVAGIRGSSWDARVGFTVFSPATNYILESADLEDLRKTAMGRRRIPRTRLPHIDTKQALTLK